MLLTSRAPACRPAGRRLGHPRRRGPARRPYRSASAIRSSRTSAIPATTSLAYDIALTYSGSNTKPLDARHQDRRPDARERLDRINLDFTHGTVSSVEVNGRPAEFAKRRRGPGGQPRTTPSERSARLRDHGPSHQRPRAVPRTPAAGCAPPTGWRWRTRPTPRTGSSPATTTPPTRRYFTFRVTAPKRAHGGGQRAADGQDAQAAPPPPGRTGPRTPWPPSWRRSRSAAPPSLAPHGAARTAGARRGARRRPRDAGALAEADAGAPGVDGAAGRPLPLRDVRSADRRRRHRIRAGDADALALRALALHQRRVPRVVRRLDHGARAGPPVVRQQRLAPQPGPICG